jgi:hypothetical protein
MCVTAIVIRSRLVAVAASRSATAAWPATAGAGYFGGVRELRLTVGHARLAVVIEARIAADIG